jgi:hypothetical protein
MEKKNSPSPKRLSLQDFKQKSSQAKNESLDKIVGGILGACHCKTFGDWVICADYWE